MKFIFGLFVFSAICALALGSKSKCTVEDPTNLTELPKMQQSCVGKVKNQIDVEFDAAIVYLTMGAYFSRDDVNRPGFAKLFFEAAKEEREHGMHLIDYLSMRGATDTLGLVKTKSGELIEQLTGVEALEKALKKEIFVTDSIRDVIKVCEEEPNDYHLSDYLTGEYLEEQYKGQRDLAGKMATLKKFMKDHHELGEFLFDKTLL